MKKLFILLVFSFTLFGCQQPSAEKIIDELPEVKEAVLEEAVLVETVLEEVIAPVRSAVFGISVDSIANGATVNEAPVVISGKVSEAAISVSVNDYQLQSYEKGSGMWSYIAKPEFQNLAEGENIYEIRADGPDGISATTILTINFEPTE